MILKLYKIPPVKVPSISLSRNDKTTCDVEGGGDGGGGGGGGR